MYYSYALLGPCTRPRRKTDEMSTDISVAGHAMTPAIKAIPTHEHNGSGNGAPVATTVARLHESSSKAIRGHDYTGLHRRVYPIKLNQHRHVAEEILDFGREYGFGVEAGSKPELLPVMALVSDHKTPRICNGFKDDEF